MKLIDLVKRFKQKRYESLDDEEEERSNRSEKKVPPVVGGLVGGPVGVAAIWSTKNLKKML